MTTLLHTHNGQRLKQIIKSKGLSVEDAVKLLQLGNNQHLHYYYNKKQIKDSKLNSFLTLLGITENDFFETNNDVVNEDKPQYISTHHGYNLRSIINNKGITITQLCNRLNIGRPKMYKYFEMRDLPLGVLLELAHVLEVPVARIKGISGTEKSFEKDVYLLLENMQKEISTLRQQLDKN